jgi:hypothetical protein
MFVHATYWMWTQGQFTVSHTIGLDRNRRYLVTGGLTGKSGGDYGQVFIATVCSAATADYSGPKAWFTTLHNLKRGPSWR